MSESTRLKSDYEGHLQTSIPTSLLATTTSMAVNNLSSLPGDVLLYLFPLCNLVDNVSLSMVCSKFYRLEQERSLWIEVLQNARLVQPIACTLHDDLTKLDLESLKRIVFHTLRLQHNWSRPEPEICGPIKTIVLSTQPGLRHEVIFHVPGTELYLFHSRATGNVSVWDIGLGTQVTPERYVGHYIRDVSPGQDEPGKFSMGLLTSTGNDKLIVACLEYDPDRVALSFPVVHSFLDEASHWAVFMTRGIVGVLECAPAVTALPDPDATLDIFALNIASGRQVTIKTDIPREDFNPDVSQSGTSTTDDDMFILVETNGTSNVYRCPKSYLPTNDNPDCPQISILQCKNDFVSPDWPQMYPDYNLYHFEPEGALSSDYFYGVPAVSIHQKERSLGTIEGELQIRFWIKPTHNPLDAGHGSYITPAHLVDVPGKLQDSPNSSWSLVLLPHSGHKVLLVMNVGGDVSLQLVNFNPETKQSCICRLLLPPSIDIREIYNLSLDDHRGVITLLRTDGTLHAIPYA